MSRGVQHIFLFLIIGAMILSALCFCALISGTYKKPSLLRKFSIAILLAHFVCAAAWLTMQLFANRQLLLPDAFISFMLMFFGSLIFSVIWGFVMFSNYKRKKIAIKQNVAVEPFLPLRFHLSNVFYSTQKR